MLKPWQPVRRAGLTITPVPVSHSVETLGLVVDDGTAAVGFPSDTGPTEELWRSLATLPHLKAVFLEASFPASMSDLAAVTGHLCTQTFAAEHAKVPHHARSIVVHRKARFAAEIAREIAAHGLSGVEMVRAGFGYEF